MSDIACAHTGLPVSAPVIPVSLLNRLARERLEATFPLCWVAGEISNLSHAASGHLYFSLKDSAAQVRCVMFRSRAQILGWRLENGQQIEARVLVTLYEARGDFQLNVEAARRGGIGNLYERFLRLQDQLASEGLFDSAAKRSLPTFPQRIGIITSPQAAALRDVLSTLRRRAGHVSIVLYPTPVQGDGAARQIAEAILGAGARRECELLIVCRGGGSIEDLWAFNDEAVARAIRACSLPVICGIGHETDFTIADFAADQRAPTPTAAAEIAAPERTALLARLAAGELALRRQIEQQLNQRGQHLDATLHGRTVSRYEAGVAQLKELQAKHPGQIAIIAFGDEATVCPGGVPPEPNGWTMLYLALEKARETRSEYAKASQQLAQGNPNAGRNLDAEIARTDRQIAQLERNLSEYSRALAVSRA